ncbi:MAG: hypothetical protein ACI9MC_002305, partial [Kiritimatiellia bacterium]
YLAKSLEQLLVLMEHPDEFAPTRPALHAAA